MRMLARALALSALLSPSLAIAGPPFLTDDPEPTENGHWDIFGPLIEVEGTGYEYGGAVAAEFNYGAAPDLQITVELPLGYSHDVGGTQWGAGDVAVSAKYRFYHDEDGCGAAGFHIFLALGLDF